MFNFLNEVKAQDSPMIDQLAGMVSCCCLDTEQAMEMLAEEGIGITLEAFMVLVAKEEIAQYEAYLYSDDYYQELAAERMAITAISECYVPDPSSAWDMDEVEDSDYIKVIPKEQWLNQINNQSVYNHLWTV